MTSKSRIVVSYAPSSSDGLFARFAEEAGVEVRFPNGADLALTFDAGYAGGFSYRDPSGRVTTVVWDHSGQLRLDVPAEMPAQPPLDLRAVVAWHQEDIEASDRGLLVDGHRA